MEQSSIYDNQVKQPEKAVIKPAPSKMTSIDVDANLYSNLAAASANSSIDLSAISSFTNISMSRDNVYNMIDTMAQDPIIATALDIYASDACETNDKGQIVWAESDNDEVLAAVSQILDDMNVDKNTYGWIYSLIKYGDIYLRLFRESEVEEDFIKDESDEDGNRKTLHEDYDQMNEALTVKAFKKSDHYASYVEAVKNPAEVFDLQRMGKTSGYIRSHVLPSAIPGADKLLQQYNTYQYMFNKGDIDIYPATDYVHACLADNSYRISEEVSISTDRDKPAQYKVKRGQSILYNVFKIWRELSLLENAVILNRITKSSVVRTVSVEIGDMEKNDAVNLVQRIKNMVEQKSALNVGSTYDSYTNPGPIENIIYLTTHDGIGAISTGTLGGDGSVNQGDLVDLDYFKNKLYGALGIPKQYLGDMDDAGGFSGGESLALVSSRYAKTVKMIQNAYVQAITDAVNLKLYDKGKLEFINEFTIRMQTPTTKEEKDRRENLNSAISSVRDTMDLISSNGVEDPAAKLQILKSLLSGVVSDTAVFSEIQKAIDKSIENADQGMNGDMGMGDDLGLGGDMSGGMDLGGDMSGDLGGSSSMDLDTGASTDMSVGSAEEPAAGGADNNLPSFSDMGVNYTDVK